MVPKGGHSFRRGCIGYSVSSALHLHDSLWIRFGGIYVTQFPELPEKRVRRARAGDSGNIIPVVCESASRSTAESRTLCRLSVVKPGRQRPAVAEQSRCFQAPIQSNR